MTNCPATRRPISTGLNTDMVIFDSLPDVAVPISCPACCRQHLWRPSDAWVGSLGRPPALGRFRVASIDLTHDLNQDSAFAVIVKNRNYSTGPPMKKPAISIDEPAPKKPLRADRPPTEGFTVIVDGHFKSDFETRVAAEASGRKLKATYPMLKIEIYDAATRVRTSLDRDTSSSSGAEHGLPKT